MQQTASAYSEPNIGDRARKMNACKHAHNMTKIGFIS